MGKQQTARASVTEGNGADYSQASPSCTMERNKWETAIRCLEVALHPNTGDDEVIAAVNGFRRTADGRRLRDVCSALAGGHPADTAAPRGDELLRLSRENRELRGKLATAENARTDLSQRLYEKTAEIGKLRDDLRAARDAADAAERRLAEFGLTQLQLVDRASARMRNCGTRLRQHAQRHPRSEPR
jgi:hypothetical protein